MSGLVKHLEVSEALTKALNGTIRNTGLSLDGEVGQVEEWARPEVTEDTVKEARRLLPSAVADLEPAPKIEAAKWLGSLGVLVAGKMPIDQAKEKLSAYSHLLSHPACVFSEESLEIAARRFKWFPSYSEIASYLDEVSAPVRVREKRLQDIASTPKAAVRGKNQEPVEERRRHAEEVMKQFTKSMKGTEQ